MNRTLSIILGLLVVIVGGFAAFVTTQPDSTHVERSVVMSATPADIFPYANDLQKTLEWSPWMELDPDQTMAFSEKTSGVGAWYTWEGNKDVGQGRQEIVESVENERVVTELQFKEPFESKAMATIALAPEGDDTKVTWAIDTENGFMAKAMGVFMNMDEAMGPDFEKGLTELKPLAEAAAETRREAEAAAAAAAVLGAAEGAVAADGAAATPAAPR